MRLEFAKNPLFLNKHQGFTLMQMLVTLGLISILSLGVSSIFANMISEAQKNESRNNVTELRSFMAVFFRNADKCTTALQGTQLPGPGAKTDIVISMDSVPVQKNSKYGNQVQVTDLVIQQATSIPNAPVNMRQATISLSTQTIHQSSAQIIQTDHFSIYVLADSSDKIVSCLSHTSEALGQANCLSIGGIWNVNGNPQCKIDPTSPSANCASIGGIYIPGSPAPCQMTPKCAPNEIFLGYAGGFAKCTPFQSLLNGICPDNNMIASDGSGNLICIPIVII